MPNDFLTLDVLATLAGAVLVTNLVLAFIKDLPGLDKLPTKYAAFIVAVALLLAYHAFQGTLSPENLLLIALNGVLVALTAVGGYRVVAEPNGKRFDR